MAGWALALRDSDMRRQLRGHCMGLIVLPV